MGYCHGTGLTSKFSHMRIISVGAGRSLAASSTLLLHFQTLKIALALASRLGDPVYDSTITESMDDMLRWVPGQDSQRGRGGGGCEEGIR